MKLITAVEGHYQRFWQWLKAGVLLEGDDIGDGGFMAIIITHDELQFDAHGGPLRVQVAGE
jgi:hypothetical protein